jgi:hypothetical protein
VLGSLKVQTQGYGNVIPLIFGRTRLPVELFFYGNFKAIPVTDKSQSGGKGGLMGGGKNKGNTTYSYTAAVMLGIAANEITGTGKLWVDKSIYPTVATVGFSVFNGQSSQSPFGYLSTYEPTKAVSLRGFAYLAANNYPLTDNATLGNHSVEVFGIACSGAESDATPEAILRYLLVNECGVDSSKIADMSAYTAVCVSNEVLFSLALTEQRQASEVIAELLNISSAEMVFKAGKLHIISYYEAGLVTCYQVTSDDFIAEQSQAAIKPTRKKAIDGFNALKLEFLNRATDYNIEIVEDKDLASIETIGLRTGDTLKAHYVTRASLARNLVHHLLQRDLAIRNSYEFTLSIRYIRLEPMDVITLTDASLGLDAHPVIIKKIVLTPDFQLKITAEDFVYQVYQAVDYPAAFTESYTPDHNAAVGNINPPVIIAAPAVLTQTGYEVWAALSNSDPLYGGCDIHISVDGGTSYTRIGTQVGNSRMGVLTADLASGSDPDTSNTLAINLSESNAIVSTVEQISVDSLATLCWVNNEFLAYRDVSLTAVSHYNLSYLRRGLYGSTQGASVGNAFVRCDDSLFRFPYNPVYAGHTIKLKFTAFNSVGGGQQDLSTVPEYSFTIPNVHWDDGITHWDISTAVWI